MRKSQHFPFFISVFGGVVVWFLMFILFPAKVVYPFSSEAFWFIFLSYTSLILGYCIFPKLKKSEKATSISISKGFIYLIIIISLLSFLIRYLDLFLYRNISLSNNVWENRALLTETKPGFIFIIASICKQFYFIPIIFILHEKIKEKKLIFISLLLFLLPFLEGFVRGSRNMFFMPVVLLIITLLYFNKIRFQKKHILIILSTAIVLFVIATSIIMSREAHKTDKNYSSLTSDFFLNDFLKPDPIFFEKIHSTENQTLKKIYNSGFQIAQYYVHGVFEFDNLVKQYQKKLFKPQYGKYTFFTINRFTNKYGLSNTNLEAVQLRHPRGITFITFFGGLYLDFGWLGILIMILYGGFQKHVLNNTLKGRSSYLPILIFFFFCNFFMLTFNFIANTGTYILVVCFALILAVSLWNKIMLKKR